MEAIEAGIDYEGDMVLTAEQLELHQEQSSRAATTQEDDKWPKTGDHAIVPYVISSSFSSAERNKIAKAIQEYVSKTCVR